MTKVQILKWLEKKKAEKAAEVEEKRQMAKQKLLDEKIKGSSFEQFAAFVLPKLRDVKAALDTIHTDYKDLIGPAYYSYGQLAQCLRAILESNRPAEDVLREQIIHETEMDKRLDRKFDELHMKVMSTYDAVSGNVRGMANAKQAAEYLKELGFDLRELEAANDAPTMALAAPVDPSFLFLRSEGTHEKS